MMPPNLSRLSAGASVGVDAKLTKQLEFESAAGVVAYDASQNAPSGSALSAPMVSAGWRTCS